MRARRARRQGEDRDPQGDQREGRGQDRAERCPALGLDRSARLRAPAFVEAQACAPQRSSLRTTRTRPRSCGSCCRRWTASARYRRRSTTPTCSSSSRATRTIANCAHAFAPAALALAHADVYDYFRRPRSRSTAQCAGPARGHASHWRRDRHACARAQRGAAQIPCA